MMATEFTLFLQLPTELRCLIWQHALPRRHVLELDAPYGPLLFSYCDLRYASRRNARPPIIARVCRESRQVALQEGGYLDKFTHIPPLGTFNKISKPWIYSGNDLVHLNWYPDYSARSRVEDEPTPVHSLVALAKHGHRISIMADLLVPWEVRLAPPQHHGRYRHPDGQNLRLLASLKECTVCLKVVSIHVPAEQVIRSGLFGGLDTPVQIVDVADRETLERMCWLWKRSFEEGHVKDVQPQAMFDLILAQKTFQQKLDDWSNAATKTWLSHKYLEAWTTQSLHDIPSPDHIWTPPGGPESLERQWGPAHPRPTFNGAHPWVKAAIEAMPKFKPAIMFRHCRTKCYALGPRLPPPLPGFPPVMGPAFIPMAVPGYAENIPPGNEGTSGTGGGQEVGAVANPNQIAVRQPRPFPGIPPQARPFPGVPP